MTKHTTTTAAAAPAVFSGDQMLEMMREIKGGPYGLIVSPEVYARLRAEADANFASGTSGNSFGGLMIAVDPDLKPGECDVAFNAKGWLERLQKIRRADGETAHAKER